MKSNQTLALLLGAVLLALSATSVRADDWKTTNGKVYQNVAIVGATPDTVTILHQDGGASVPLANLPANIQKQFNYDPVKAKAAADDRAKENAANAQALQAEMDQAAQAQAALANQDTGPIMADPDSTACTQPAPAPPAHYSMDDLAASVQSLGPDPSDSTHHTMSEIADSGL